MTFIKDVFDRGRFTNRSSPPIRFRNNAIAHNRASPILTWDDVDKDLQIIARIWGLLSTWSSIGIIAPFRDNQAAFSGLEPVFTGDQLGRLQQAREKYIERAKAWSRTSLVTGKIIEGRYAHGLPEVQITLTRE